ncbi:MAG: hypothetical protein Q7R52_04970 [archaeon]|nr:hypothetical protein [archaeon]
MAETFMQEWIVKDYILPFLLLFALTFGVLEKTKLLGDKKQLNAIISFVVASIFVGVLYPKQVVSNMILFLTVALVMVFVFLLLYGFVSSGDKGIEINKYVKGILLLIISVAVIIAIVWATGVKSDVITLLFGQGWSQAFWTNAIFIVVIAVAMALVLRGATKK